MKLASLAQISLAALSGAVGGAIATFLLSHLWIARIPGTLDANVMRARKIVLVDAGNRTTAELLGSDKDNSEGGEIRLYQDGHEECRLTAAPVGGDFALHAAAAIGATAVDINAGLAGNLTFTNSKGSEDTSLSDFAGPDLTLRGSWASLDVATTKGRSVSLWASDDGAYLDFARKPKELDARILVTDKFNALVLFDQRKKNAGRLLGRKR